jgi:hypothetical protein
MMGREVAIVERQQPPVPAFGFNEVEKIATAIARGGLFGSKDPYAVLTLCMLAQAEGQHPAVVFRDYDLIQGKPAKKAEAMLRDFIGGGGKVTWNRLDDECADATFSHPQGGTVTINWTMARAQKAQLGGKDMWKKYPRQMLRSRVVSEGVRTVYPNATSGLYVPEEVSDLASDSVPSDTPATPQPQRARDLKAEAPKQIEATATDPAREKAEAWVDEFIGKLGETDVDGARALFAKSANAITKLEREHPDLHAKVLEYAPSEEPYTQPEAAATRTLGEQLGLDDPTPAETKAAEIIAEIGDCISTLDVTALVNRHKDDIAAMPDELGVKIEVAADKRRKAIEAERAKAGAREAAE